MWNDKLIAQAIDPGRGTTPIAWVPKDRIDAGFVPIIQQQVQPASLDVRLSNEFITHPAEDPVRLPPNAEYMLLPGECVLGCLVERVCIPDDAAARVEGKSSWARQFLTVHSAGFIDPGFTGDITLELKNDGKRGISLHPGQVIAQMSFHWLVAPAVRPYGSKGLGSHYQGQKGPTTTWV